MIQFFLLSWKTHFCNYISIIFRRFFFLSCLVLIWVFYIILVSTFSMTTILVINYFPCPNVQNLPFSLNPVSPLYSSILHLWVSQVTLVVKNLSANTWDIKRYGFSPWVWKIPWRRPQQPTPVFLPGEPHGKRSLVATVHRVAKSQTQLKWLSMHTFFICSSCTF